MSHLVEAAIRAILDNLEGNVGSIDSSREIQSADTDGDTPLGALSFVVGNGKLVATIRGVEVIKRVGVGVGGNLYSDWGKKGELEKGNVRVSWTDRSTLDEQL